MDSWEVHNQARIINNDCAFSHIYIAVMNNFTHGRKGHLRAIMDSWDHQLFIEYEMDIV